MDIVVSVVLYLVILLGLFIQIHAENLRRMAAKPKIERNVEPLSPRDAAIKERIETTNRQSVLAIKAGYLRGYHEIEYSEEMVTRGVMRGTTFNLN